MNSEHPDTYDYQVGGGLRQNAFYVWRKADEDLSEFLKQGEFCYIFNCRQMGKSSLRVKAMERLKSEGVSCGAIDLTNIGKNAVNPEKWYGGIILELHRAFKLNKQVNPKSWLAEHHHFSPLQQLRLYLEDVILAYLDTERIVIFIEEIDTVLGLNFPVDDFFALIRSCYNQRAENSAYKRLTFVLLGVATPSDLVQDLQQAPFNIGRAIILEGLEFDKSGILAEGLVEKAENPQQLLREILQWTGGQPFLTQKLCQIVQNQATEVIRSGEEALKIQQLVQAKVLDNWEFQDDPQHLRTIRDRLFKDEQKAGRLLGLYQQILEQGSVIADGSSEQMDLKLSGLAVKRGDRLVVYNPIYQEIFNQDWLEEALNKLRDPFYSEAITAWLASGKQDESRLLRGQSLQMAQEWAQGKSLGDEDYQFLRASEQLETVAEREAKAILTEANRKAKQKIRVGSAVLIISLILAGMATAFASYLGQQNKNLADSNQDLKQNNEQLILGNDQLNQQQETLNKQIQDKEKEIQSATKKLAEADKNRDKALKLQKQAEQQSLLAKGNQFKTEEARKQAELDLARAENKRQTAIKQREVAQAKLKDLEQKRRTIEQHLKIAKVELRQAEQERQIALAGTKLEQQGTNILQRFKAGTQGQIESLFEAMEIGQDFYKLVENGRDVSDYPAISPLYTLHEILQENTEKNIFQHQDWVHSVAFSPDGKYLATSSEDGTASLWDLKGNLIAKFKGHKDTIFSIVFSPDGKYLATGSKDKTAGLWKLQGSLVTEVTKFNSHKDMVTSVAFSPDGKYLATGGGTARLWDLKGKLIAESESESEGYGKKVISVAFSPDGKYLATGYTQRDNAVRIWDLKGNLKGNPIGELKGYDAGVRSVAFSPDGKYLATASIDGTARLWRPPGILVKEFQHQDWVNSVAFSPDGQYLATTSNDRTARLWNLWGPEKNLVKEFKGHQFPVFSVAFSSDGKYLATASSDNTARLWNLQQNLVTKFKDHQSERSSPYDIPDSPLNYYNSVAISPDGKYLATGSRDYDTTDNTARLWDFNGKVVARFKMNRKESAFGVGVNVAFSPDGKYLATVDKIARLWDLNGKLVRKFEGHQKGITSVAFSPDGKYLATGSDDKIARLWNFKGEVVEKFKGHQRAVSSLSFSPNGKYLATGSDDNTARLWDLKGNFIAEFKDQESVKAYQRGIRSVVFSPDGKYLVATGSLKSSVNLWKVEELPDLLARGCNWLSDYLASHPDDPKAKEVREICKNK